MFACCCCVHRTVFTRIVGWVMVCFWVNDSTYLILDLIVYAFLIMIILVVNTICVAVCLFMIWLVLN